MRRCGDRQAPACIIALVQVYANRICSNDVTGTGGASSTIRNGSRSISAPKLSPLNASISLRLVW
jgi:hypothetical protein